ncbi:DinB family protein [Paenibacillus glacialis]|uniref:DinB family protein n=1 Tax=Paenibacillus glacialis TaxID=494026 RepID=UPI0008387234|nr:DinB family protein [Paenibacillus glacialis]
MTINYNETLYQNNTLNQLRDFLPWVEELRGIDKELWLKPIATGKWAIREILTHIMSWDKNSLEVMVPNMVEGASLFFVDIQKHNEDAAIFAQSYATFNSLLDDLVKARLQLLELLEEKYNDITKFNIDNDDFTFHKFVHIFIHHDEHHKAQIVAFLDAHNKK